jgi:hypothetical protein
VQKNLSKFSQKKLKTRLVKTSFKDCTDRLDFAYSFKKARFCLKVNIGVNCSTQIIFNRTESKNIILKIKKKVEVVFEVWGILSIKIYVFEKTMFFLCSRISVKNVVF